LRIEQAIFGEYRGGHALRQASGDERLASELSSRLDLPDTAPSGLEWSPFMSGFAYGERYVLARTFLDTGAPRAGMVLSHALIAPLRDIIVSANLRPLFDLLLSDPRQPATLSPVDLDLDEEVTPVSPDLVGAAEALTTRGNGPVVRLGTAAFDNLVLALWSRLWPEIRATFAYRLSFGPGDLVETPPPALVCTPAALVARWRGHRVIDSSPREPVSISAAMLSGRVEGEPIRAFGWEIGANLGSFAKLPLLEQAYRLVVSEPDTFGHSAAAVRLVEKLSPDPTKGGAGKGSLLNRLTLHIESADATAILTLRNLQLDAFEQPDVLWAEVQRWVAEHTYPSQQDSPFLSIVEAATRARAAVAPWREAVIAGLRAASKTARGGFPAAFWRWADLKPSILCPLVKRVEIDTALEGRLVQAAPRRLKRETADAVMQLAAELRLLPLHGVAASTTYTPLEAARRQIAVEGPSLNPAGLKLSLRNATPPEILTCTIEIADPRLIELAGEAVADRPTLLAGVGMTEAPPQAIWRAALSRNPAAWRGPEDPRSAFSQVLTNMLDGGPANPDLLAALAATPLGDLTTFARRFEVLRKVGGATRARLRGATAEGWIEHSRTGTIPFALDADLQAAVLTSSKLGDTLEELSTGRVVVGVQIAAALSSFQEQRMLQWVQAVAARTPAIPLADAEALGRLTLDRTWHRVANELVYLLRQGREEVRPALRICGSLLSLFTRWTLNLSSVTSIEKWESFEVVAVQLYPSGPDEDELWERAGGSNADLRRNGSGRSRWHETLEQIRRGGRGPKVARLIREMQKDFPSNEQLHFLAGDYEFGGRR
jgi:hypothetical protein